MIIEVADIAVAPERQEEFTKAIVRGVETVISKADGYQDYQVLQGIESPGRFLLQIKWKTLENHTVDFRQSEAFSEWRSMVGPFFLRPPIVEHFSVIS